jgi:hypothetical protein
VRLKAGPFGFAFPNTAARVRSVKLHDLHHVLTGYETTWSGEAEIAAWEIASGCKGHYAAWILNFGAFAIGLYIAPRRLYRAFLRGRRSRNLYDREFAPALLDSTVEEMQKQLELDGPQPRASLRDRGAFACWSIVSVLVSISPWLAGAAGAVAILRAIR